MTTDPRPSGVAPLIEASIEIFASPERVWALVSDPCAMSRFSPQVMRVFVRGGGSVGEGSRTFNVNRRGLLVWSTRSKIVGFEPGRRFAWRVKDNFAIWSFTLEPTESGTLLTERRETPQGTSEISAKLVDRVLGGQEQFTAELRRGMLVTLRRIKAEAERARSHE